LGTRGAAIGGRASFVGESQEGMRTRVREEGSANEGTTVQVGRSRPNIETEVLEVGSKRKR
jgi:hypothetical protein